MEQTPESRANALVQQSAAVTAALAEEDPLKLANALNNDEIRRLELAEKVLELEHNRRKRVSRFQNVVSLVAFGGLAVNAFQSYNSGQTQEKIRETDQKRWAKEFDRAKEADRYNAFLATSALATDSSNADKRLVGYALLQEFVDDKEYNNKTAVMLEQALFDELDRDTAVGLSDESSNSVNAILGALSGTSDCASLGRAVRSVARLSKRKAKSGDVLEAQLVFELYVRRIYGRAAQICKNPDDFAGIERPLRETLEKVPEIGNLPSKAKVTAADANKQLAQILIDSCRSEMATGVSDCPDILRGFDGVCQRGKSAGDGAAACALMHEVVATLPAPLAKVDKPAEKAEPQP